jgi:hypothetical protein
MAANPQRQPLLMTVDQFSRMIDRLVVWPGDLVLCRGRSRWAWLIERSQRRMLRDLCPLMGCEELRAAAWYTHAMCVLSTVMLGEMTSPVATCEFWARRLQPGDRLLVRRPQPDQRGPTSSLELGQKIAEFCGQDVLADRDYPERERLVYYLWSWGLQKLTLGRRFVNVFTDDESDVCSGRYWYWCTQAGVWTDLTAAEHRPEGHYPAELAVSRRLRTIAEIQITEGQ